MTVRKSRKLSLEELRPYLLDIPDPPCRLNLEHVFGNDRPIEIEIGFGKGLFLLTSALARPDTNLLGVEIERKYQLFTATRLAKRALVNVRLVCGDARQFLRDCLADGCMQAVHVYFPDPWWKNRHRKRRVFTADFAAECSRILQPGGRLHVATDVEEYFGVITELLAAIPTLRQLDLPPKEDAAFATNFERKSIQQGRPVFRAEYERVV